MSQPGKQAIAKHILPNISSSKGNQITKYDQKHFLEKLYPKCGGETISKSFSKNQNWPYFWIDSLKFYTVCFYCILKLSCKPLAFISYKAFLNNKRSSGTGLPDSFSAWFLKKNISLFIIY